MVQTYGATSVLTWFRKCTPFAFKRCFSVVNYAVTTSVCLFILVEIVSAGKCTKRQMKWSSSSISVSQKIHDILEAFLLIQRKGFAFRGRVNESISTAFYLNKVTIVLRWLKPIVMDYRECFHPRAPLGCSQWILIRDKAFPASSLISFRRCHAGLLSSRSTEGNGGLAVRVSDALVTHAGYGYNVTDTVWWAESRFGLAVRR